MPLTEGGSAGPARAIAEIVEKFRDPVRSSLDAERFVLRSTSWLGYA
jgi:hypothetical protein